MKIYKYLVYITLIHLFLFSLNANEKPIIEDDNFNEEIINNEIDPQFCFSFKVNKLINPKNTSLMTREDYLRKARGFLAMGIIGLIITSLYPVSSAGFSILLLYTVSLPIAAVIIFFLPLFVLGISAPFLIVGFVNYRIYKNKKFLIHLLMKIKIMK